MDEDLNERIKALRRDYREMGEDIDSLRKRKANGDDVEMISSKVVELETDLRARFASAQAERQEIRNVMRSVLESLDALRADLQHHKRDTAEEMKEKTKGSVWGRIPPWAFLLMGVGLLALLQLGPTLWLDIKNLAP